LSSGYAVADNCDIVSKNPQLLAPGVPLQYCHREQPWLTQVKLLGSYRFPHDIDFAATFQSIPITSYFASNYSALPAFGIASNYVAANALVAPSLGRNLAAGPTSTVTVNVVTPGAMLPPRTNQLDLRLARTFRVGQGQARLKGIVDLYNVLNASTVLTLNNTYGTTGTSWLVPTQVLEGRLLKFGVQLNF
jgi:hypothetical protein